MRACAAEAYARACAGYRWQSATAACSAHTRAEARWTHTTAWYACLSILPWSSMHTHNTCARTHTLNHAHSLARRAHAHTQYHVVVPDHRDARRQFLDMPLVSLCHLWHHLRALSPAARSMRMPLCIPTQPVSSPPFSELHECEWRLCCCAYLTARTCTQAPGTTFAISDSTGAERLDEFEQVSQREPSETSFNTRVTEVCSSALSSPRLCVRVCVCVCVCVCLCLCARVRPRVPRRA